MCTEKEQAPGISYFLDSIMFSQYFLCYKLLDSPLLLTCIPIQVNPNLFIHFCSTLLLASISLLTFFCQQNTLCPLPFILVHLYLFALAYEWLGFCKYNL